jgi:hypothetical protein
MYLKPSKALSCVLTAAIDCMAAICVFEAASSVKRKSDEMQGRNAATAARLGNLHFLIGFHYPGPAWHLRHLGSLFATGHNTHNMASQPPAS